MDYQHAQKNEQALVELVDSQLICQHENTILVGDMEHETIYCNDCGYQEVESEYTDRKEKYGI